jgi:hypothetical protein
MATDGVSLFYNPDFVETLNAATLAGTLAHEVMHPALHHHVRRSGRDPKRWNVACDFAINPLLVDAGLSLPDGVLIDNRFRGMSAEQIYNLLELESETEQDPGDEDGDDESSGEESKDETSGRGNAEEPSAPVTEGGIGQVLDGPQPDGESPANEEQVGKTHAWRKVQPVVLDATSRNALRSHLFQGSRRDGRDKCIHLVIDFGPRPA